MAEAVRAAVSLGEPLEERPTPSASIGWAVFPDDGQDFETLMRSADHRMLRIKRSDPRRAASATL
jgi:GGDEF domain-containing protein